MGNSKKYKIIYADSPWAYDDKASSGKRGAFYKYNLLTTDEICNLDIDKITDKDSILLLWVTFPMLKEGLQVVDSWGYKYKTNAFTWIKTNKDNSIFMGMGRYTRGNPEICLLATKGKGLKRQNAGIRQVQLHQRLSHSEKPGLFRELIVDLFGDVQPRIELFARQKTHGWDAIGYDIDGKDIREVIK